ncbi:hypothetical protein VKT23_020370 [Stygiomarasmius scandens]|uniref:Uncharacterized protein n=1 Tax=Marasmiellus scandens TaxID=2682957 RepID=A0ABR1IM48_9AGAR
MVNTRAKGIEDNEPLSAPAARTRSHTKANPSSEHPKPAPKGRTVQKKTIKVPFVEIAYSPSKALPSISSAPRPEERSKKQVRVPFVEIAHSPSKALPFVSSEQQVQGEVLSMLSYSSAYVVSKYLHSAPTAPHNSPPPPSTRSSTPHPSPSVVTSPAHLEPFEPLDMLDVTYADLEREEVEARAKKVASKLDQHLPDPSNDDGDSGDGSEWGGCASEPSFTPGSHPISLPDAPPTRSRTPGPAQSPTRQEQAVEALRAYVTSSMGMDDIIEKLEGILGKLSSDWYEAIADATREPDQTVEEVRKALEERVPSLLGGLLPHPTGHLPPTPQEIAVETLRQYIMSSMRVDEITEELRALLGELSSDWHTAITSATAEPGQSLDEVQEAFEKLVPSLLGGRRSARQRNAVNYHLPPVEGHDMDDYDDGSSDWGAERERERELARKRKERTRRIREKNGETVETTDDSASDEESDSSSEESEEDDPPLLVKRPYVGLDGRLKRPRSRNANKKVPASAQNKESTKDVEQSSDESEDEDGSGRVPAVMKAEIWKIRADYEERMEAVAQRFNHSLQSAYKIAGDVTIASRDPNLFNIFQKWYVAEDGKNKKIPESVNPGQYLSQQWQELRRAQLGEHWNDPAKVEEEFASLRQWHSSRYSNDPKMTKGPTKHDVRAVAKIISDVAKQATLNRGIWVYAFIVDPTGHHSMISGWGKEYENMKVAFPSQITSQLHDVGILLGGEHIKAQIGSAVSAELKSLVVAAAEVGNDRDRERALVPKILLHDIGTLGIKHPARFPWKNFSDYAYKHQIRILNWPEDIAAPGAGLKDVNHAVRKTGGPSSLTAARIEELLWLKDAWARKDSNPTPPEHITSKALRVVSWSEGECLL